VKQGCGEPDIFVPSGCSTGPKPTEGDEDQSVRAGATDDDKPAQPTATATATAATATAAASTDQDFGGGDGCWSPTRNAQSAEGECVQSSSNNIFFQCNAGKWYRGVNGDQGPYGKCQGVYSLSDSSGGE
jgi:hypothetical protein